MKISNVLIPVFIFSLAGCTQLLPHKTMPTDAGIKTDYWLKPGQAHVSSEAVALLYYADYVRNIDSDAYADEVNHARQLYENEKSAYRQLQYAIALELPGGDSRKAQQLIDSLPKEGKAIDPELNALAQWIAADLTQRQHLETDVKKAEAAGSRRVEAGAKRADELEKKVEALKNVEKNLIQRAPANSGNQNAPAITGAENKP